jgi:hypothetical protein
VAGILSEGNIKRSEMKTDGDLKKDMGSLANTLSAKLFILLKPMESKLKEGNWHSLNGVLILKTKFYLGGITCRRTNQNRK